MDGFLSDLDSFMNPNTFNMKICMYLSTGFSHEKCTYCPHWHMINPVLYSMDDWVNKKNLEFRPY